VALLLFPWQLIPSVEERRKFIEERYPLFRERPKLRDRLIKDPKEGHAWNADHIKAVAEGGGECTSENMRTLCVICHARVTAEMRKRNTRLAKSAEGTMKLKDAFQMVGRKRKMIEVEDEEVLVIEVGDDGVLQIQVEEEEDDYFSLTGNSTAESQNPTPTMPINDKMDRHHSTPLSICSSSSSSPGDIDIDAFVEDIRAQRQRGEEELNDISP